MSSYCWDTTLGRLPRPSLLDGSAQCPAMSTLAQVFGDIEGTATTRRDQRELHPDPSKGICWRESYHTLPLYSINWEHTSRQALRWCVSSGIDAGWVIDGCRIEGGHIHRPNHASGSEETSQRDTGSAIERLHGTPAPGGIVADGRLHAWLVSRLDSGSRLGARGCDAAFALGRVRSRPATGVRSRTEVTWPATASSNGGSRH